MRNRNSKLKKAQTTVAQVLSLTPSCHIERLFRFGSKTRESTHHRRTRSDPVELDLHTQQDQQSKSERGKRMTDFPAGGASPLPPGSSSPMDHLLGLLRIRVKRGVNLAVRDVRSSDPYCVVRMGKQVRFGSSFFVSVFDSLSACLDSLFVCLCEISGLGEFGLETSEIDECGVFFRLNEKLKTRFVRKDINPEWNEDLTLSIMDPEIPVKLTVYDHDTFSLDDKMGNAEFDIRPFMETLHTDITDLPNGTIIKKLQPSRQNCFVEDSTISYTDGKIIQEMCLRLRKVECGEIELQLQWIDLPGARRFSKTHDE
ncbi:Protein C2-DOMAIN ABA-RELATED 4 [Linum perenne]